MNRHLLLAGFLLTLGLAAAPARADVKKFAMNTVEVNGVKMWLPSTIVVNKGDEVEITAKSRLGTGPDHIHGFTIEAFKIVEAADDQGKVLKFKANRKGIFPIKCHLHPAHIGAQLVVL